jgi:putative transposase
VFIASATCSPSCPNASAPPPGRHSTTRSTNATASNDYRRSFDELDRAGCAAAARCLADDLDALVVHLRYPTRHRRRWRSTNALERSLGEVKRRTVLIGRFPGETSCLTLVWAVLDLYITNATNGIRFSQLERQRLKRLRDEGHQPAVPEAVNAA